MRKRSMLLVVAGVLVLSFLFVGCSGSTFNWLYGVWKIAGWGVFLNDARSEEAIEFGSFEFGPGSSAEGFSGNFVYNGNKQNYTVSNGKVLDGKTLTFTVLDKTFVGDAKVGNVIIGEWK